MPKLYALLDMALLERYGIDFERFFAYLAVRDDVAMVQYRNKHATKREKQNDLKHIRRFYRKTLIINDDLELIEFGDGIHLGQEDLYMLDRDAQKAIRKVRDAVGKKIIGLSTHNLEEIKTANDLEIDYIGLGAYRTTQTKLDAVPQGQRLLKYAETSKHPVALIGGVRLDEPLDEAIAYRVVGSDLMRAILDQGRFRAT